MTILDSIETLPFDAKIRAKSAYSALQYVDLMIDDFLVRTAKNKADILLDVFGVLQGLFVAIDGLYQLSFATTKYKYHININQNRTLRLLKYLRNDVVGHPTNRSYSDGTFGFSLILEDEITKDHLSYVTYIMRNKDITQSKETIYFDELIQAYKKEKSQALKDLENYLHRQPSKIETTGYIVQLFEKASINSLDVELLSKIRREFLREQNLSEDSNNRFIFRLDLLKSTFDWKDSKFQDVIHYIVLKQILSLYKMNLDLSDKKIRIPVVELPTVLRTLKKEIQSNAKKRSLITHLNDKDYPMFQNDLEQLIYQVNDPMVKEFLNWFKKISDNNHKFLVGKTIKDILS